MWLWKVHEKMQAATGHQTCDPWHTHEEIRFEPTKWHWHKWKVNTLHSLSFTLQSLHQRDGYEFNHTHRCMMKGTRNRPLFKLLDQHSFTNIWFLEWTRQHSIFHSPWLSQTKVWTQSHSDSILESGLRRCSQTPEVIQKCSHRKKILRKIVIIHLPTGLTLAVSVQYSDRVVDPPWVSPKKVAAITQGTMERKNTWQERRKKAWLWLIWQWIPEHNLHLHWPVVGVWPFTWIVHPQYSLDICPGLWLLDPQYKLFWTCGCHGDKY